MGTKGMKLTDNPKDAVLNIRLDAVTAAMLETLAEIGGRGKSHVVREAIKMAFEQNQKKRKK